MILLEDTDRNLLAKILHSVSRAVLILLCVVFIWPQLLAQVSYHENDTVSMLTLLKDSTLSSSEKLIRTLNLSNLYESVNPAKALFYDSLTVVLAHRLGKEKTFISALQNSAKDFQKIGNYTDADILYHFLHKQLNDSSYTQLAQNYYDLGVNYYLWGKYKLAAKNFQKSRNYYEQLEDKPGIAKTLLGEAKVWNQYNDYFQAVGILQRATDIYNQLDDQNNLASVQSLMGKIMQSWGQLERARYFYKNAYDYYHYHGDNYHESKLLINLGNLFLIEKDYPKALRDYKNALSYSHLSFNKVIYAKSLRKIGEAYYYLKNYDSARYYQGQAIRLIKPTGNKKEIGNYLFDMGQINFLNRNLKFASLYADSALSISDEINSKNLKLRTLELSSEINQEKGLYKLALNYLTQYNKIYQEIFSEKNRKMVSDMEVHYEADQKAKEYNLLKRHDIQTQINLAKERNFHNLLIIIITIFIVVISIIVVFFIQYENKINKKNYALILAKNQKITAQQKTLEKLNDELFTSRESYRSIVENATIGMYQISPSGKILFANKALLKMISLDSTQDLQKQVFLQIRDPKRKQFIELLKKQEIIIGREGVWQPEDGNKIYVNESAWIIKDYKGNILYFEGIVEDITKRKIAEDKVHQTQEMLKQKNEELIKRNEDIQKAKTEAEEANTAKTMFLANFSHEIRTPLNSIIGFAYLLRPMAKSGEDKTFVDSILVSSNSLLALINDILDLSKIQAGRLELNYEPAYIPKIINEIKQIFYPQIEAKNLKFSVKLNPLIEGFYVVDATRLRQVLFNIVGNAIKFTDEGSVEITADAASENGNNENYNLIFKVKDTGSGIPEEERSIIFDAFKQIKGNNPEQTPGTGLGLSISQRLIEMMGGNIELKSEIGKGTTFTIHLKAIKKAYQKGEPMNFYEEDEQTTLKSNNNESFDEASSSLQISEEINKLFGKTYHKIINNKSIVEIMDFGETLLKFGKEKQNKLLQQECTELLDATNKYDIEIIEKMLRKIRKYFRQ